MLEYIRYTNRIPITQEFVPTEEEQVLYDMVSDYLRRPSLNALPSSQRVLMTLIMRKLLASSTFAIAGALDSLARKLDRQLRDDQALRDTPEDEESPDEISSDIDGIDEEIEEWEEEGQEPDLLSEEDIAAIEDEIADLRSFRDLAVSIAENAKGQALLDRARVKGRVLGMADALPAADLLVNSTSLGMVGQPALDLDLTPLPEKAIVYDIVYAPLETGLLKAARARGLRTLDGLEMLIGQAALAFDIFFDAQPPRELDGELRERLLAAQS